MGADCCQPKVTTMILACSGGSNVGQLSNQAAVELTQEGFGKLSCLAGVGAHLSGFVQSARDIDRIWWSLTAVKSAAPKACWSRRRCRCGATW